MNPRHWKREHQLACALVSLIGGMVGMLVAWSTSWAYRDPDFDIEDALRGVASHWPWPVFSAFIAGATFYTARLLQIARRETVEPMVQPQPNGPTNKRSLRQLGLVACQLASNAFGFAFWGVIIVGFAAYLLQLLLDPRK